MTATGSPVHDDRVFTLWSAGQVYNQVYISHAQEALRRPRRSRRHSADTEVYSHGMILSTCRLVTPSMTQNLAVQQVKETA